MKLAWHPNAWDEYVGWQTQDRKMLKRINTLIKDVQRGDDRGIGKPAVLKGDLSGWASRRINKEHRLVYRIVDAHAELQILSCRYHYTARGEEIVVTAGTAEVTPTEAAALLGLSRPQVRKLMDHGLLEFRKVGARDRIRVSAIRGFLEAERPRRRDALAELAALQNDLGLTE